MNFPAHLRYTKEHEWISLDGNIATVGITDHAQNDLGDIAYVDVNAEGKSLPANGIFGVIETSKAVADLFLPVAGVIVEVNTALNDHPELVNDDPYGKGWMVKVEVNNPEDINSLLDSDAYQALLG